MKIVRNDCFGGFRLSPLAIMEYAKLKGIELFAYDDKGYRLYSLEEISKLPYAMFYTKEIKEDEEDWSHFFNDRDIERDDSCLVEVVEKLGKRASGFCSRLIVVEIPNDVKWEITQYDGLEKVEEVHRSW